MKPSALVASLSLLVCTAAIAAPAAGTSEPLLSLVPARAKAAVLVRHHAIQPISDWLFSDADMLREMRPFLDRTLGIDITRIDGVALFVIDPTGANPATALVMRVPGNTGGALHLPAAGDAGGTPLYKLDARVFCARLKTGFVMGTDTGVRAAVAVDRGAEPALARDSALGKLLSIDPPEVDLVAGVGPGALPPDKTMGIEDGVLTMRRSGLIEVIVHGNPTSLGLARTIMTQGLEAGLAQLQTEKDKGVAGNDPAKGVGALIAYYQGKKTIKELTPVVEGNSLKVHYQAPDLRPLVAPGPLLIAMIGGGAAIALPAIKKFSLQAKLSPARTQVQLIASKIVDWAAQGKKLTALRPTEWAPGGNCCGAANNECVVGDKDFAGPTWQALGVMFPGTTQFRYRLLVDLKNKRVTVQAEGDPDCDGIVTTLQSVVTFDKNTASAGEVVQGGDLE